MSATHRVVKPATYGSDGRYPYNESVKSDPLEVGDLVVVTDPVPDADGDVTIKGRRQPECTTWVSASCLEKLPDDGLADWERELLRGPVPADTMDDEAPETVTVAALAKAWGLLDFDRLVRIVEGHTAADKDLLDLHLEIARAIEKGI